MQQVRGGMQTGALGAVIRQTALEALFRARLAGGLMLLEALLKAFHIHGQSRILGQFAGHFHGESVGVVQVESAFTVDAAVLHPLSQLLKFAVALLQGLGETGLLQRQLIQHEGLVALQLGVHVLILLNDDLGDLTGETFGHPDLHAVADGAADQAAQYIALIHIGGADAPVVAHDEGGGAHMVGDDAEGLGGGFVLAVGLAGKLGDLAQNVFEQVGLIDALFAV